MLIGDKQEILLEQLIKLVGVPIACLVACDEIWEEMQKRTRELHLVRSGGRADGGMVVSKGIRLQA